MTASIRSILSSATRISLRPPPTKDKLLGTELLLLESTRKTLSDMYQKQVSSGNFDVVTTGLNTSVTFLQNHSFFEDMSRNNDISYYKVGRGKKGIDPITGEEYAFEKQDKGYRFCIPRFLVSHGEMIQFSGMLIQKALEELKKAMDGGGDSNGVMTGASIFMEDTNGGVDNCTQLGLECFENQLQSAAGGISPPDVFCIECCDTAEKLEYVREILRRNEKRMIKLSTPNTTGHMTENDFDTEVGFDIPAVILRDGVVDEII